MPYDAAQLYGSLCDWWFRKSRWLKRKGSPTCLEVLHRIESLKFPQCPAEALVWCRKTREVLPELDESALPPWYAAFNKKLVRWQSYFAEALTTQGAQAPVDWTCDQLLAGVVNLEEAIRLVAK